MKKLVLLISVCAVMFVFTGCAGLHSFSYETLTRTEVVLSENNFRVVGPVEGTVSSTYIFGIGGMSKKTIRDNAVQQMFKNANLKGSQAIINVNISTTDQTVLGVWSKKEVTAYGTIIEYTK
jgi:uncharacterized protein YbjQ (UPF0145 family)